MEDDRKQMMYDDPGCGFMVKSYDEHEVVHMARIHIKDVHKKEMTEDEIMAKMVAV